MMRPVLIAVLALVAVAIAHAPEPRADTDFVNAQPATDAGLNKPPTSEADQPSKEAFSFSGLDDSFLHDFLHTLNSERVQELNIPELTEHLGLVQSMTKEDIFASTTRTLDLLKTNPALKKSLFDIAKAHEEDVKKYQDEDFEKIWQELFGNLDLKNLFGIDSFHDLLNSKEEL